MLLEQLDRHASLLTFDRYLGLWSFSLDEFKKQQARRAYAQFSKDSRNLDRSVVQAKKERLERDHRQILDYINNNVAHLGGDVGRATPEPTYKQMHDAFDDVAAVLNSCLLLLTASTVADFEPILPLGFERAFARMLNPKCDAERQVCSRLPTASAALPLPAAAETWRWVALDNTIRRPGSVIVGSVELGYACRGSSGVSAHSPFT
jgi:hypothetical protein